ncbi:MAG: hypothetical protein RMK89_06010 [Armatimonadota bacterium]|nr:hypothetical protein [Armatimonadota bacterium]MDW8143001.1 hypothetical protein [Armatimonadota bacterium]
MKADEKETPEKLKRRLEVRVKQLLEPQWEWIEDLTSLALVGIFRPINFWQKERVRFAVAINRKDKSNALLLGNYETALLLVQQFACDLCDFADTVLSNAPLGKIRRRLFQLDWTRLQSDEAIRLLLEEVRKQEKKPLLFVGTVDDIVWWSDVMLAAVQQGIVHVIATATPTQWEEFKNRHPAAASTFTVISVGEPDEGQTLEWQRVHKTVYAHNHFIAIDDNALTATVELAKERFPDQPLLATARNLLDEVCAYAWIKATEPPEEIRKLRAEIERLWCEEEKVARALGQEQAAKLIIERRELQNRYKKTLSEWHEQLFHSPPKVTVETIREFSELLQ